MDNVDKYDPDFELKMKKLLSKHLPYICSPIKNNNPYDYDIQIFKYDKTIKQNICIGYVEIERSFRWNGFYPWKYYSFLQRKVHKWDGNRFIDEFKDNYDKTVYLRTNFKGTDMFCLDIYNISKLKWEYKDTWGKTYNDCYFRTNFKNEKVRRGIKNCMEFIEDFLIKQRKLEYYL